MAPKDVNLRDFFEHLGMGNLYDFLKRDQEEAGAGMSEYDATVVINGRIRASDKKQARKILKCLLDIKTRDYSMNVRRIDIRQVNNNLTG